MKNNLILTGWHHPEYLAAAAAMYGLHCKCDADVLGASMAGLAAILDTHGSRYRNVYVLGVGLTENLVKLSRVLKELSAAGVSVKWISRQDVSDVARKTLESGGVSFLEKIVRERTSLLDVVTEVFGDDGKTYSQLSPLCDVAEETFHPLPDISKCTVPQIWAALYDAAGFAHRDNGDESACGDVVKALWNGESVKPQMPPRLAQIMDDYRSGYSNEMIGKSPAMSFLKEKLAQAAGYDRANVLLLGETGTGKQVAAEYIHSHSARHNMPFEHYNCAYGNGGGTLLMDRLFGHEKGSYTGAVSATRGLFDDADGGTLFLDEIGEAGADVQAMLLTVLETGCFTRIGGDRTKSVRVDVRLICATNRDLQQMVLDGRFRLDLYERISDFPICIEPLRNRREDIEPLARHYWLQLTGGALTSQQTRDLMDYSYPGNVRELVSLLKQACATAMSAAAKGATVSPVDFKKILTHHKEFNSRLIEGLSRRQQGGVAPAYAAVADEWPDSREELLALHTVKVYEKYGRDINEAAAKAGVSLNTFKKYLAAARS